MSERAAQTSAISLKAAGSMPMLGPMPSGKLRELWARWLHGDHSPHGRVAEDLVVCSDCCTMLLGPQVCFIRLIFTAVALTDMHFECHHQSSSGVAYDAGSQARATVRDDRFQRFYRVFMQMHMQQATK